MDFFIVFTTASTGLPNYNFFIGFVADFPITKKRKRANTMKIIEPRVILTITDPNGAVVMTIVIYRLLTQKFRVRIPGKVWFFR
jgi:hypothetical protein